MSKKILKNSSLLSAMMVCLLLTSNSAMAGDDGKAVYSAKGCAACHGEDAKTPIMPAYPKLAGQGKEYLEQQLKDIKSGARSNGQSAAMKGVMAAVSDEEIATLAGYLAGLE